MKFRKFTAPTVREALLQVREELGPDAVIIRTEKIKKGLLGGSDEYCVTAALDESIQEDVAQTAPDIAVTYNRQGQKAAVPKPMQFEPQTEPMARPQVQPKQQAPVVDPVKLAGFDDFRKQSREDADGLRRQLSQLQEEVQNLKSSLDQRSEPFAQVQQYPVEFRPLASELGERGLSKYYLNDLVADLLVRLGTDERSLGRQRELARQYLETRIVASGEIASRPNRASTILFVGPTGVGKTTTIAKLAARLVLSGRTRVGILSTDSYRIGAIEQMQQFADAAEVDFEAVFAPEDLDMALEKMADKEFILIDTAGRSLGHEEHLNELRDLCRKILPDEVHLVLAANTRDSDLAAACAQYKSLGVHRLLFTKIDETREYAGVFNLSVKEGIPLSYFGFGQRIPDDLRKAEPAQLATWILGDQL